MTDPLDVITQSFREPGLVPGYEISSILGSGGQGIVFKAKKTAIGRTYAIKFLRPPDHVNPTTWRNSELGNLAALADMRHPNLVAIEDRGETKSIPYLVLEYAGDQSLKTLMTQRRLGLKDGLRWLRQTADAVQYLHDHGVLHLDVKPSNIYVLDGRAKLGDFGLVRLQSHSGAVDLSLAFGTPEYVAPEVVSLHRASPVSDVFGLGRTLDDLLIAAAVTDDRQPASWLMELATESTAMEPTQRPSLIAFRKRLAAPGGIRKVAFRSLRPEPRSSGAKGSPRFRSLRG
ncbi:MAG: hypothetical protein CMJ83_12800 [Planctomycetes bacterium]|nr:hypothetical protein [Planctomycetota bacterium]